MTRVPALLVLALGLTLPAGALAQDVGTVASVAGQAEVGRGGNWGTAAPGMGVQLGDQLQTKDGRMRVVFQDDSVLNLAENTTITVDDQIFQPEQGTFKSLMKLMRGKVRATVGSVYQQTGSAYEIETPTAVAGVRGTTFLVSFDADSDVTEVLGIRGRVHVRGLAERLGDGVFVTAHEITAVDSGAAASKPERLDEQMFRDRVEGLEILGLRGAGDLMAGIAVQTGAAVAAPDRAPLTAASKVTSTIDGLRDASDVTGQPIPVVQATRGSLGVPF